MNVIVAFHWSTDDCEFSRGVGKGSSTTETNHHRMVRDIHESVYEAWWWSVWWLLHMTMRLREYWEWMRRASVCLIDATTLVLLRRSSCLWLDPDWMHHIMADGPYHGSLRLVVNIGFSNRLCHTKGMTTCFTVVLEHLNNHVVYR